MNNNKHRDYSRVERLQAFILFLDKGSLEVVKKTYPQHVSFVQANMHKSYQQVKDECLGLVENFTI